MKSRSDKVDIVANGRELIRDSERYRRKEEEIRKRICNSYRDKLAEASWWRKPFLKWKIEREIQKELDVLAPSQGLYSISK